MIHKDETGDLLTAQEAAQILSKNAGRPISQDYVRTLASKRYKKLTSIPLDRRTKLYRRSEVEQIKISDRPGRRKTDSKNA
jgi:hypothetical protein